MTVASIVTSRSPPSAAKRKRGFKKSGFCVYLLDLVRGAKEVTNARDSSKGQGH